MAKLSKNFDLSSSEIDRMLQQDRSREEFAEKFFDRYRARANKTRWADKTPRNVRMLPYILEHFPKARFVYVIRDGRDVLCSLSTHPRRQVIDGEIIKLNTWNPIEDCIGRCVNDVGLGLAYRQDPRYTELRYEDLVLDMETTLRNLFEFLQLDWEPAVMNFHEVHRHHETP